MELKTRYYNIKDMSNKKQQNRHKELVQEEYKYCGPVSEVKELRRTKGWSSFKLKGILDVVAVQFLN